MNSAETLGVQAALRALKETREGVQDPLLRDRLERIGVVLSRVGMNISRRADFEAGLDRAPSNAAAAVAWEAAKIASWEGLVSTFEPAARREEGGDENLTARLQSYFRAKFPDLTSAVVSDARRLPGGRSKHTFVMSVANAGHLPGEIVLRSDSSRTTTFDSVAREFPLIEAVYKVGCPALNHCGLSRIQA
jgi:hypothetical protein